MFLSPRRWFKKKGPSAWGAAEPRARAVLAERDFGAARHVPLASPLVQEEGGRRLGAPLSRGLGRCLQSATWGRLAMFLSLRRWFKKKGAVGLGRRQAEGSGGACRARLRGGSPCSSRFAASSRRSGAVGLGRRQAEGSGGACRARLRGGSPCSSRFAASSRRRGPSAWGAAKPRARAVLAERDFGAARHVPLASPLVQEEGAVGLGRR